MIAKSFQAALLCAFCMAAFAAQPTDPTPQAERFVSQLSIKNGHLAWQDVRPGANQHEVEVLLGAKLSLESNASGRGAFTHQAVVARDGVAVRLGFYTEGGTSVLTEIALAHPGLTEVQLPNLRAAAKVKLKGLRDSGSDFPLAAPGGEELDIREGVVRVQIGSNSE